RERGTRRTLTPPYQRGEDGLESLDMRRGRWHSAGVDLPGLGWNSFFKTAFAPHAADGLRPARVALEHKHACVLFAEDGEFIGEASGRLLRYARRAALPAVGDWVAFEKRAEGSRCTIHAVLPRRTAFSRRAAGGREEEQVVAANIDTVFLVSGLDVDFNLRRMERYLALARASGVQPVLVLNKLDACLDLTLRLEEARGIAGDVPTHAISAGRGDGIDALGAHMGPGKTIALLGSSGVGKSTLVNRLFGGDRQAIGAVKEDDGRGRHTTTRRELIRLADGTLLIDTPGMREIQLWASPRDGLNAVFPDIVALGAGCRFRDCRHGSEPGCAVRAAAAEDRLPAGRFASFQKLRAELEELDKVSTVAARTRVRVKGRRILR
ncbi:MAG: ribosome small subunit-dependent GTPase A, partial [Opitutaceae bacterium]